jgi:hypothetical protein
LSQSSPSDESRSSAIAHACGEVADQINRQPQLGLGLAVLIGADLALVFA